MKSIKNQANITKSVLICGVIGFIILMLTMIAVTFISMNLSIPQSTLNFILLICLGISGFISGNICGQIKKENGFILGILCGLSIFVILLICSLSLDLITFNIITSIKLLVLIICSIFGGILGVNKKEKRINIKNKS